VGSVSLSAQGSLGLVGGGKLLGLELYGNAFEFWQYGPL
jgi:hypothetical protein